MKKYLPLMALLLVLSAQTAFAEFTDVEQTHSYGPAITWLQEQGVVEGYSDGTFKADQNVNRAEFLKMLYETMGSLPDTSAMTINFPDVPANAWYTKYVAIGYDQNIVEGYPDGYFRPENPINRAEALKIVTKKFFTNEPELYFESLTEVEKLSIEGCEEDGHFLSDVEAYSWYEQYIDFAHSRCLIPETMIEDLAPPSDDLIMPDKLLTRGEMAELLFRAKALSDSQEDVYDTNLQPNDLGTANDASTTDTKTYSDDDLSFIYPNTWELSRTENIVSMFTGEEGPAYEGNCGSYCINIFNDSNEANDEDILIESSNQDGSKNLCVQLTGGPELNNYTICKYENSYPSIEGDSDVYYLIPDSTSQPRIFIFDNMHDNFILDELIPGLSIK